MSPSSLSPLTIAAIAVIFVWINLTIADIYQIRRVLEPELAASLAGTLSEDALKELESTIAAYSEPTGNLDSRSGQSILDLMLEFQKEFHTTLLMVTHNPDIAQRADIRFELTDGRLAQTKDQ